MQTVSLMGRTLFIVSELVQIAFMNAESSAYSLSNNIVSCLSRGLSEFCLYESFLV